VTTEDQAQNRAIAEIEKDGPIDILIKQCRNIQADSMETWNGGFSRSKSTVDLSGLFIVSSM